MFLYPLKTEQKKLFLGLAKQAAMANAVLEESEKHLLAAYADEMGIAPEEASDLSLDALCGKLKELSSAKELNQMTFEIIGMLLSDSEFDSDEQLFLTVVTTAFEISEQTVDEMRQCVHDYTALIKRINKVMFGGINGPKE